MPWTKEANSTKIEPSPLFRSRVTMFELCVAYSPNRTTDGAGSDNAKDHPAPLWRLCYSGTVCTMLQLACLLDAY